MQGRDADVDGAPPQDPPALAVPDPVDIQDGPPPVSAAADPPPPRASPAASTGISAPIVADRAATPRRPATVLPTSLAPATAFKVDPDQQRRASLQKPSKVGRNDPCPCGSGNKYKRCCGRLG